MRISTQTLFESGAAQLSELQSGLARTQQQVASGRRILTPSDDPVAAARALEVSQSQSLNAQHGVNRQYAQNALSEMEGTLSSVTELMQDVKTTIITAGNGTLNDADRGFLAAELSAHRDALLGLANSRDGMGNYMFSGFQTATPAFSKDASGAVTYDGDAGQRLIQVDSTRRMSATAPGSTVFQGGGQDVFATLSDLIALLQTPVVDAAAATALTNGLAIANTGMDLAMDNVLTVRASAGSRLQELDTLDYAGEDRHIQYSQILSDLQDLDYNEALTRLSQQEVTLEAAQRSFVTVSGLSLFNFL